MRSSPYISAEVSRKTEGKKVAMSLAIVLYVLLAFIVACHDVVSFCSGFSLVSPSKFKNMARKQMVLASSFYGDFEDFDDEDDDDEDDDEEEDDDEYEGLDDAAVANFRSKMGNLFGNQEGSVDELISFATSKATDEVSTDWAHHVDKLEGGVVLVANPAKFCTDFGNQRFSPSSALLSKFGLTLPPPADLGPDRRADLLPVLVLLEKHPLRGSQAVLMNRRTGYLLGDLEQSSQPVEDGTSVPGTVQPAKLGAFMIQPLWFGGTSAGSTDESNSSSGLDMLHLCPAVQGAKQLTNDGLYWGGDPSQAQEAMNDPSLDRVMTGFDFKFFVQSTRWLPLQVCNTPVPLGYASRCVPNNYFDIFQLENEVRDETWFAASVSKEVLFKSRDRMGTRRAKPLWTEIMELMGGKYTDIRDQLYEGE